MRRLKIAGVGLSLVIMAGLLHLNFGLFNRFNFATAHMDKWAGNERIIVYGERFEADSMRSVLAPSFGFKYERQADCTVTTPFVNGINDYNEVMGQAIAERLGASWDIILDEEVLKKGK